jgi:hypothetical protein
VREQRQYFALILAIGVTVGELEQQFRKGALPPGHRMQGRADSLAFPQPLAFPERPGVAAPVDRAKRDNAEPELEPGPEQYADANSIARRSAQPVTLEFF